MLLYAEAFIENFIKNLEKLWIISHKVQGQYNFCVNEHSYFSSPCMSMHVEKYFNI